MMKPRTVICGVLLTIFATWPAWAAKPTPAEVEKLFDLLHATCRESDQDLYYLAKQEFEHVLEKLGGDKLAMARLMMDFWRDALCVPDLGTEPGLCYLQAIRHHIMVTLLDVDAINVAFFEYEGERCPLMSSLRSTPKFIGGSYGHLPEIYHRLLTSHAWPVKVGEYDPVAHLFLNCPYNTAITYNLIYLEDQEKSDWIDKTLYMCQRSLGRVWFHEMHGETLAELKEDIDKLIEMDLWWVNLCLIRYDLSRSGLLQEHVPGFKAFMIKMKNDHRYTAYYDLLNIPFPPYPKRK